MQKTQISKMQLEKKKSHFGQSPLKPNLDSRPSFLLLRQYGKSVIGLAWRFEEQKKQNMKHKVEHTQLPERTFDGCTGTRTGRDQKKDSKFQN